MQNFLPATGFLRQRQILGDKKLGILGIIPVSAATWWGGVKSGRYPTPVRIGPHMVAWRVEDIRKLRDDLDSAAAWEPECRVGRKAADDGARTVTADALAQRIRRRLTRVGKHLVAARSNSDRKERGNYYLADIRGNPVETNIDLNQLGRELGALKPYETVAA